MMEWRVPTLIPNPRLRLSASASGEKPKDPKRGERPGWIKKLLLVLLVMADSVEQISLKTLKIAFILPL